MYFSNDEEEVHDEVFFDDFSVVHEKSNVVQVNDYYAFGLTFNSYQREISLVNDFKFQSQEHVDELGLNWDSFKWRNHQPDIGRFFNVDPLAEKYVYNSPYAFSENHVVAHRELEGLEKISAGKRETDQNRRRTDREIQRREQGRKPNLDVIPANNTTETNFQSTATGGNFVNGQNGERPQEIPRVPFTETRQLEIIPFNYKNGEGESTMAQQNIFRSNNDLPKGAVVESATLDVTVDVISGNDPQTMIIQQGNKDMDGNGAGITLLNVNIQEVNGTMSTSIPLQNISPNTNLSVQFNGGGSNQINVSATINVSGTKTKVKEKQ